MKNKHFIPLCLGVGIISLIIGFAIFGAAGKLGFDSKWDESTGTVYEDLKYGDAPLQNYDLLVPSVKKDSYGMAIYFHAGGFTGGDKKGDREMLQYFTSKGYVSAGINYTLRTEENNASVYQMTLEARDGIIAACKKAEELGYPIHGLAICGGSAGATLAMVTAFRDADVLPAPVRLCVSMVGGSTFEPKAWYMPNLDYTKHEDAVAGAGWCMTMCGEEVTPEMMASGEYLEKIACVSSYTMVTDSTCAFLGAYGKIDKIVPYATVPYLKNALDEHHINFDLFVFPNSGHGLQHDKKIAKAFFNKFNGYLETYL